MSESLTVKEKQARIKIVLFTSKTLADGSHPFVVRIHKGNSRKHISTGLSLHPHYWNPKKQEIRQSYPTEKRKELEANLEKWKARFNDAAHELATNDVQHDATGIYEKVANERNNLRQFQLLSYFDELIKQLEEMGNIGNRKVYRDIQNNLAQFIKAEKKDVFDKATSQSFKEWSKDIPFDQITVKFCNEWERKMKAEGLNDVTLSVKFRTLRAVINKAIANGYAKPDNYPFARNTAEVHKFQVGKFDTKTQKRAINKADIRKIEAYKPDPCYTSSDFKGIRNAGAAAKIKNEAEQERLQLAKDLFLFSYYCGGVNFIDMAALTWANIITDLHGNQRLNYTRQKTGGQFSIRLMPVALDILDRYRSEKTVISSEYIFPILNITLHKTPLQKHNRCAKVMSKVNADLKKIGSALSISTPLTTYVARHSFATSLRMAGHDVTVISQAMGHADEATTRIYLQELGTELIDAAYNCL